MPYQIIRSDITNLPFHVDAIVNTAHPDPTHGLGTDAAIFRKAGPELKARRELIGQIQEGCACVTPAFNLNATIIIHTVAPVWRGGRYKEEDILRSCYLESLQHAKQYGCNSVAFPLIGSGNLGFPHPIALKLAVTTFMEFCFQNEISIFLVLFDKTSFEYGKKIQEDIPELIDDSFASEVSREEYRWEDGLYMATEETYSKIHNSRAQRTARKDKINDILRDNPTADFSKIMKQLIQSLENKYSDVYHAGNISPPAFYRILDGAKPKKPMAVTVSLALVLDLEQTKNLIARAGHTLDPDNSWDSIIINSIEALTYDVSEVNRMLEENGHTIFLGSK